MNSWNALLEALHSALIDELVERHPKPKPELGRPTRGSGGLPPNGNPSHLFVIPTQIEQERGFVFLSVDAVAAKSIRASSAELWNAVRTRAQGELLRRGLSPTWQNPISWKGATPWPSEAGAAPGQTVWFPFGLGAGNCLLGIGI